MTNKTMVVAGQRISVAPFSDYLLQFLHDLFIEGELVMDLRKHSAVIEMAAELVAPALPKRLYKKSGATYYWLGSMLEFGELVSGMYLSYWQYELERAQEAKDETRIAMAQEQISLVQSDVEALPPPLGQERSFSDLQKELAELRAKAEA
jgi:hypothetical protein